MKKLIIIFFSISLNCLGQNSNIKWPPKIKSDTSYIYKKIDSTALNLWIFNPPKHEISESKPAIVFFFGGGWNGGTPKQFVEHSKYLSARGIVSIVVDYRVLSRNKTKAIYCLKDAKSAIRWVRKNSKKLGINPTKIISSGGSAGGHLAAATGTILSFDEESEDKKISSKPNAMILFNPIVITSSFEQLELRNKTLDFSLLRVGVEPDLFSPYNFIDESTPPTLVFHGDSDKTVDPKSVVLFKSRMNKYGNICKLYLYKGEEHGFFNYGKNSNGPFIETMHKVDKFLVDNGYLPPPKIFLNNNEPSISSLFCTKVDSYQKK